MKIKFKNICNVTFSQLKDIVLKDKLRPSMCGVHINITESRFEATNTHALIIYPIEIIESDTKEGSFIVPVRFFNHLKYMQDIKLNDIDLLNYVLTDDYAEVYFFDKLVFRCDYIDAKYPNINGDLPKSDSKKIEVDCLGLNFNVLKTLISAMPKKHPNEFKLSFYGKNKRVIVEPLCNDLPKGVLGLIMPIMLFNEN